jgi:hypothetical protein
MTPGRVVPQARAIQIRGSTSHARSIADLAPAVLAADIVLHTHILSVPMPETARTALSGIRRRGPTHSGLHAEHASEFSFAYPG